MSLTSSQRSLGEKAGNQKAGGGKHGLSDTDRWQGTQELQVGGKKWEKLGVSLESPEGR